MFSPLVPSVLALLLTVATVVRKSTQKANASKAQEEEQKKAILNDLAARARANEHTKKTYGIVNSFVSDSEEVRFQFRHEMKELKDALDRSDFQLLQACLEDCLQKAERQDTLKRVVNVFTMYSVLAAFIGTSSSLPSVHQMLEAADLIESRWSSGGSEEELQRLHAIIPPAVLAKVIPAYESQSRLIFFTAIEYFRHKPNKCDFEKWIVEALRLYAPVKQLHRKNEQGEVVSFPIASQLREEAIWGPDANEFNPERVQQPSEVMKAFGMGELRCIAGLNFVKRFCGTILKNIAENYEVVEEGEWEELPKPLENKRGLYAVGLRIARKAY